MRKGGTVGRKVSPTEAVRLRQELVARLNAIAPHWSDMSHADLSKLLVAQKITTATGKRFAPERVRDFRRSLAKVAVEDPFASKDLAVAAEAVRVGLLQAISELREPITEERRAEIDRQVKLIGLVLCEDRFADHTVLHNALEIAERGLTRPAQHLG